MAEFWRQFEGRELNGRYKIVTYIGSGAMGGVFMALDLRLGRSVAIKLIDTARMSDQNRRRFAREAEAAARINSPHVVVVHDSGTEDGLDYLVMELLQGVDLKNWLAENPSPPLALRLEIIRQVALGLAAGHTSGIVHRDIKPSNLVVTLETNGGITVKLVDFGIAKPVHARNDDGTITIAGEFVGTPLYASPEQWRGEVDLTPSSDVFSLGILTYMLMTGFHPFSDDDRTRLFNGNEVPVASPQRYTPELPDALCNLIQRALNVSPAHRPQTAGAFADELAAVMRASTLTVTGPLLRDVFTRGAVESPTATRDSLPQGAAGRGRRTPPSARRLDPIARRGIVLVLILGGGYTTFTVFRLGGLESEPAQEIELEPTSIAPRSSPADLAQKRMARRANSAGLNYLKNGNARAALNEFKRAVELQPTHPEYLDNLGLALRREGRLRESVVMLEDVVRRYPRRASAHYNLAESYLQSGDTANAVKHLEHCIPLVGTTRAERVRKKIRDLGKAGSRSH